MRTLLSLTALSAALLLGGNACYADTAANGRPGATANVDASVSLNGKPCEALNGMPGKVGKRKGGPIRKVLKGIAAETSSDLKSMADDSIFVFSASSMGPDHTESNTRPYQAYEMTLMNGDIASVTAFPDGSFRVNGGTFDGTCGCHTDGGHFNVYYPNGAVGTVKPLGGGSFEVIRPDKTVTTFKKSSTGGFRISNSATGYAGEMTPDEGDIGWKLGPAGF